MGTKLGSPDATFLSLSAVRLEPLGPSVGFRGAQDCRHQLRHFYLNFLELA